MVDIEGISVNIKKYRILAGLTQAQVAEKMFIAPQTVSKWERGLSVPSISELACISDILSVPIGEFLDELPDGKREVMIAVDGGGTKTDILLFSADADVGLTTRGVSNPNVIGLKGSCEVISEGIDSLITEQMRVSAIYCGIAGAGVRENASVIQAHLKRKYPSAKILVESDMKNVIGLADDPDNCIAVIMGTGSSVLASANGKLQRVGGWGYVFDGAGSGYDIGREVIKRTLAFEDGIGEYSEAVRMCQLRLGAPAFSQIALLHERGVDYIASFAPIALEEAKEGDAMALEIIRSSTDRICMLIEHAMKNVKEGCEIVLAGGLCTKNDIIATLIREKIKNANVKVAELPQIFGAVRMCLAFSGNRISNEELKKIKLKLSEELK